MEWTTPEFRKTILNTVGEDGSRWLAKLDSSIEKYLTEWKLSPDGKFQNLSFNFVLPVQRAGGAKAVLKMGPHAKSRSREARALKFYDGAGAVRLLEQSFEDGAMLIERVTPGTPLHSSGLSDEDMTLAAIGVMDELLRFSREPKSSVLQDVSTWGLGFEKYMREYADAPLVPFASAEKADRIFKQLVRTSPRETVLHGDLHHSNILDTGDGWLAIDPKGLWGDPCFEIGAFIRNPWPKILDEAELKQLLFTRMQFFSDELGFDMERVWGWAYSQAILASIWGIREKTWESWYQIAQTLEELEEEI